MKYNRHLDESLETIIKELTDAEFEQVSGGIVIGEPNGSNPFPSLDTSWISDLAEKFKSFPGTSTTPDKICGNEPYDYGEPRKIIAL
jgi:hypothetical protein